MAPKKGPLSSLFIRTKLSPPRHSRKIVRREAAVRFLAGSESRALALIKAPAGFGKTTLLTTWRESLLGKGQIVGWLTLDEDDNDINRFAEYLIKSLSEVIEDMPEFDHAGQLVTAKIALTSLINGLDEIDREITLILDDYNKISDPEVHDLLAFLLRHIPANLHIVIATRSDPPLPLSSLRAHDQLVEIDVDKLRFGIDDTCAFFTTATSVKLSASETRALHDAAEGWVAGLQIAALALPGRSGMKGLLTAISGQSRGLSDYLTENVLARIAPDIVELMLRTSIVDRLSPGLCEHISSAANGKQTLDWLVAQNLFLRALDGEGGWYRYHGLFLDFLRSQLEHRLGDELPALHLRAAQWFSEHGLWAEAVKHALAADRADLATEWFELCAMREFQDSRVHALLTWARKLPKESVRQRLRLRLILAWALVSIMRFDETLEIVEDIERQLEEKIFPETANLRLELRALRFSTLTLKDDMQAALEIGKLLLPTEQTKRKWGDMWPDEAIHNCLILCYKNVGQLELARSIDEHWYRPRRDDAINLFTMSYRISLLACCDLREGNLHAAARRLNEALLLCEERLDRRSAAASVPAALLAGIHYEWGELDKVEELLADRLDVIGDACCLDAVLSAYIFQARVWALRGDFDAAHKLIDHAEAIGDGRGWPRLLAGCAAERQRLWLLEHRAADAERTLRDFETAVMSSERLGPHSESVSFLTLMRARQRLHRHAFDEAVELLEPLIGDMETSNNRYAAMQSRILLAIAHEGAGNAETAATCLSTVFAFGESANLIRSIVDEREGLARIVKALPAFSTDSFQRSGYQEQLWEALELIDGDILIQHGSGGPDQADATDGALSDREKNILELVSKGLSNKQIAKALLIAPETVKWHLKNVYGKLGVSGRTLAVYRARQMALIPELTMQGP